MLSPIGDVARKVTRAGGKDDVSRVVTLTVGKNDFEMVAKPSVNRIIIYEWLPVFIDFFTTAGNGDNIYNLSAIDTALQVECINYCFSAKVPEDIGRWEDERAGVEFVSL